MTSSLPAPRSDSRPIAERAVFSIILALTFSHFLNDTMQWRLPALYPMMKDSYGLSFAQIGLITLAMQVVSSLLQPMVGLFADHRPQPYSLAAGMGATFIGLLLLANAYSFLVLLLAAALVGTGSAVFHPEGSRVARMASGGRHGLAQSLFQVGGNAGSAIGPILAALIVIPKGQSSIAWFSSAALLAMIVLVAVGNWYRRAHPAARGRGRAPVLHAGLSRRTIGWSVAILMALVFSKAFYTASLGSYYTFYLIHKFDVSVEAAQLYLFAFLAAVAVGTLVGGPIGDRIGRKAVIWGSIVGVIPFTLALLAEQYLQAYRNLCHLHDQLGGIAQVALEHGRDGIRPVTIPIELTRFQIGPLLKTHDGSYSPVLKYENDHGPVEQAATRFRSVARLLAGSPLADLSKHLKGN